MIDNDVSKMTNLENEISVNVESAEVTPSLGDECRNTEAVQDARSEKEQTPKES